MATSGVDGSLSDVAAIIKKGVRCEDVYNLSRVMGKGGFATVKLGKAKSDGSAVAVKVINKTALSESDTTNLGQEIIVMASMKHSNIVQLLEVYEDSHHMYLVMELMRGGELFDRIVKKEHYSEGSFVKKIFLYTSWYDCTCKLTIYLFIFYALKFLHVVADISILRR